MMVTIAKYTANVEKLDKEISKQKKTTETESKRKDKGKDGNSDI